MRSSRWFFAVAGLLLAGTLAAQTPPVTLPRKVVKLNSNALLDRSTWNSTRGNLQVVSPKEVAPPSAAGLHATPLLAYAAWAEMYGTPKVVHVMFSASTDGGFTWGKAKEVYKVRVTGSYDFENMIIGATGNQVYIGICSGTYNSSTGKTWPNDVFVVASPDEGKTWIGPTKVNTVTAGKGDADNLVMACTNGVAHIGYKFAHFTSGTHQGPNDYYYLAVNIKAGKINIVNAEKKINNPSAAPGKTPGVTSCNIDADGSLVTCVWADARVTGSNRGNLYVSVSKDGGKTFKETQLTHYNAATPRTDRYWDCNTAVSGKNIYIAYGGVYTIGGVGKWPNNTSFIFSNDMGSTFKGPIILNPGGKGFDADKPRIAADGDVVCVVWTDDRDGGSNKYNSVFAACDDQGGRGFLSKVTEIRLGTKALKTVRYDYNYKIAVNGRHIVIAGEEMKVSGGGEDAYLAMSDDGGKTFQKMRHATQIGGLFGGPKDVDDPRVSMSRNGDVFVYWADDRLGKNNIYLSGLKLPELTYLGGGKGFTIGHFTAAEEGNAAIILVTEAGTAPPLNLDSLGYIGFSMNFAIGTYTSVFATFTTAYVSVVNKGVAKFPYAPDGLGIFHAAALGLNTKTMRLTWFTDPVVY